MSSYTVGWEACIAKLQTLKKTKMKSAIRKGTRAGAKILQGQAKQDAPSKTGALIKQIKVRSITRSRIWTGTKVELQIRYGAFTELGTRKEKALHFLQRAAKQAGANAMRIVTDTIQQLVSSL